MSATHNLLTLDSITKRFGGLVAVNTLSFEVESKSVHGLIGPNGSGKSTTLNLLSGALALSSGEITLDHSRLTNLSAHQISKLGISRTFQLVRLLPSLTVAENVMVGGLFGHRPYGFRDADRAVSAVLDRVDEMVELSDGRLGDACARRVCPMTTLGECNGAGRCVDGACECVDSAKSFSASL